MLPAGNLAKEVPVDATKISPIVYELNPVPPYKEVITVPAQVPEDITPTLVKEEDKTLPPKVDALNTETPAIKYAFVVVRLEFPLTSRAYVDGVLFIPTKLFVVSTTRILVPSAFCNAIPVVAFAPGLIAKDAFDV